MKKDFRYVLKPKREVILTQSYSSQFMRPRTSKYGSSRGDIISLQGSPKSKSTRRSNWTDKPRSHRCHPDDTMFGKPHSHKGGSRRRYKYKDDYLTRTLKKSPEKGDAFCTLYKQDFARSYKFVKPPSCFFQENKSQERPMTQSSQGSARSKRFR